MARILFLDFDGPLYSHRSIDAFHKIRPPEEHRDNSVFLDYWLMDPVAVALMNELAASMDDLKIVLSTSWVKPDHTAADYQALFKANGLNFELYQPHTTRWFTPRFEIECETGEFTRYIYGRWSQINRWLLQNDEPTSWAIVDDAESGGQILECDHDILFKCVMVDIVNGLKRPNIFRLRNLLLER